MEQRTFVSRAGHKLCFAIEHFGVDVQGKTCADFGCSTGGFTDCMLQNGASRVYAVDTGYGELEWKLRQDERVVVMERTNALHVELPQPVDFISIDVGWTKQSLIIPHALESLAAGGEIITLVKPHYEADRLELASGKVREDALAQVLARVQSEIAAAGGRVHGVVESPLVGTKGGNIEYLLHISK